MTILCTAQIHAAQFAPTFVFKGNKRDALKRKQNIFEQFKRVNQNSGNFWKGVGNGMRGVFGDVFIFHLIQYTYYNSKRRFSYRALTCKQHMHCKCVCESEISLAAWTTKTWMINRVGAVDRRALLIVASYIPTLKQRSTKRTVSDITGMKSVKSNCAIIQKKKSTKKAEMCLLMWEKP